MNQREKASASRTPDDINILLADGVIHHVDGKISALGLFQVIMVSKFPAHHRFLTVIVELSCGMGHHDWSLNVSDPNGEKKFSFKGQVKLKNYADKHNIVVQILDLRLEGPGEWLVEFGADGQVLKTRKFFVQEISASSRFGRPPAAR